VQRFLLAISPAIRRACRSSVQIAVPNAESAPTCFWFCFCAVSIAPAAM
jgi:hypothetical protein